MNFFIKTIVLFMGLLISSLSFSYTFYNTTSAPKYDEGNMRNPSKMHTHYCKYIDAWGDAVKGSIKPQEEIEVKSRDFSCWMQEYSEDIGGLIISVKFKKQALKSWGNYTLEQLSNHLESVDLNNTASSPAICMFRGYDAFKLKAHHSYTANTNNISCHVIHKIYEYEKGRSVAFGESVFYRPAPYEGDRIMNGIYYATKTIFSQESVVVINNTNENINCRYDEEGLAGTRHSNYFTLRARGIHKIGKVLGFKCD